MGAKIFFLISSDIDDCYPSPCKNNGTCIDGVNNYTCSCVPGFEGKNCTISKLLNNFNNFFFFKLSVRDIKYCFYCITSVFFVVFFFDRSMGLELGFDRSMGRFQGKVKDI